MVRELDALEFPDSQGMEGLVHEGLDRREHGGDEVGVLVRRECAGQVDEGDPSSVDQEHVLGRGAKGARHDDHDARPGEGEEPGEQGREQVRADDLDAQGEVRRELEVQDAHVDEVFPHAVGVVEDYEEALGLDVGVGRPGPERVPLDVPYVVEEVEEERMVPRHDDGDLGEARRIVHGPYGDLDRVLRIGPPLVPRAERDLFDSVPVRDLALEVDGVVRPDRDLEVHLARGVEDR